MLWETWLPEPPAGKLEDGGVPVREPELLCAPVGGGSVVDSVTLGSIYVTVVEVVVGGVPKALVSVGGAPGLLVSVDGGADEAGGAVVDSGGIEELEAGGAGGGDENSVEAAG